MNPRYRSRVGAPPQLAADAAASAIFVQCRFWWYIIWETGGSRPRGWSSRQGCWPLPCIA